MTITTAVVPVAGLATRLRPLSLGVPKGLLPVAGRPVVQHIVDELEACGIERVVLVTGRGRGAFAAHFAGSRGPEMVCVDQPVPLGLGDAILRAAPLLDGPFVIALGDALLGRGAPAHVVERLGAAVEGSANAAVAVEEVAPEDTRHYGIVAHAGEGDPFPIAAVVEKPAPEAAPSSDRPCAPAPRRCSMATGRALARAALAGNAQAHEGLVFMDFAGARPRVERLDPALLPPLYLAWRADAAETSHAVHGGLRDRAAEPRVRAGMARLAGHARAACEALRDGDHAAFAQALDASFDERAALLELDPRHVALVRAARAAGASANYAGSGGAIVGTLPPAGLESVARALDALGCEVIAPSLRHGLDSRPPSHDQYT